MTKTELHRTVFLHEAVDALALKEDGVVVDATGGGGGHSKRILEELGSKGTLIIIDKDPLSLQEIKNRLGSSHVDIRYVCDDFRRVKEIVSKEGFDEIDGVLADLGWNSEQFQTGGRGFSFLREEPVWMTYGDPKSYSFTAQDILNDWKEETIADVLYAYADETYSRRIAHEIVTTRQTKAFETTTELVGAVLRALPKKLQHAKIHPATKTFQALRIAVNDELDALKELIDGSLQVLKPRGRLAVITFHSIEDRIVKNTFKDKASQEEGILITKKPIAPSSSEVKENPRSRSAKLRIIERI